MGAPAPVSPMAQVTFDLCSHSTVLRNFECHDGSFLFVVWRITRAGLTLLP